MPITSHPRLESTGGVPGTLDGLIDVVITTPSDNEVLAYDSSSGDWINQTPVEAGLSAVGHQHTESDITDLTHYTSSDFDTDFGTKTLDDLADGTTYVRSENNLTDALKTNYDTAYSHSQITTGNPHSLDYADIGLSANQVIDWTSASANFLTTGGGTFGDDIIFSANKVIRRNTSDASDNGLLGITGGGAGDTGRGAIIYLSGNERTDHEGELYIAAGNDAANGNIRFITADVDRLVIDYAGNFGFGVVPEASFGAYTHLRIGGNSTITTPTAAAAGNGLYIMQNAYFDTGAVFRYIITDEASRYFQVDGKHIFDVAVSGTADDPISWLNALTINNDRSSDFGGDITSLGVLYSTQASGGQLRLERTTIPTTGQTLGVIQTRAYDTGTSYEVGAAIYFQADANWGSDDCPTRIIFYTCADGAKVLTAALTIDDSQVATFANCIVDGTCEIFTEDALSIIEEFQNAGSGNFDEFGHEKWDMEKLYKKYPYLIYKRKDGWYGDKLGARSDLLYRAVLQLRDENQRLNEKIESLETKI